MKKIGSPKLLFENLNLTPIHTILWTDLHTEGPGRPIEYNPEWDLKTLMLRQLEQIPYVKDLVKRLRRNPYLRRTCGYGDRAPCEAHFSQMKKRTGVKGFRIIETWLRREDLRLRRSQPLSATGLVQAACIDGTDLPAWRAHKQYNLLSKEFSLHLPIFMAPVQGEGHFVNNWFMGVRNLYEKRTLNTNCAPARAIIQSIFGTYFNRHLRTRSRDEDSNCADHSYYGSKSACGDLGGSETWRLRITLWYELPPVLIEVEIFAPRILTGPWIGRISACTYTHNCEQI